VADTDTNFQLITDEEIAFFLSQSGDNIYSAGAGTARAIAAKFSRNSDVEFDGISISNYESMRSHYLRLASQLETQQGSIGSGLLGGARFNGISKSEMELNQDDTDIPQSKFTVDQFANPGTTDPSG
jgi:hypothetical protein